MQYQHDQSSFHTKNLRLGFDTLLKDIDRYRSTKSTNPIKKWNLFSIDDTRMSFSHKSLKFMLISRSHLLKWYSASGLQIESERKIVFFDMSISIVLNY